MDAEIAAEVAEVTALVDPVERSVRAHALLTRLEQVVRELGATRKEALQEWRSQDGVTQVAMAQALGVGRSRIGQLVGTSRGPERAFLGSPSSPLVVALGGKQESGSLRPGPVVAEDDLQAYDLLQKCARDVGLNTTFEVVKPPGMLDLNRDNLIVVCGPRLSPLLAQVLDAEKRVQFRHDETGWYLADDVAGQEYRSPMDSGQHGDYAYLARLPRFDGQGTFLYMAGVHAMGCAGAMHYIVNNLASLHSDVKRGRFVMLIAATFDPDTRAITSSTAVSPIYRQDGER